MTPLPNKTSSHRGFTLPVVLILVAALLILAIGLVAVLGVERKTARSYVDLQRADLATEAGLEEVKGILNQETANDDYLVVSGEIQNPAPSAKENTPYLYLVRGSGGGDSVKYTYTPLFSTLSSPDKNAALTAPYPESLVGSDPEELDTQPWYDPARIAWIPIRDAKGKLVSRYAYWVEDLQGKLDTKTAGNTAGDEGAQTRAVWPDATNKPLSDNAVATSVIAPYALDPNADDDNPGDLEHRLTEGRKAMLSPNSVLGAAGFQPPLNRLETGLLDDPLAASVEKNTCPVIQSYLERPIVPHALGISEDVAGQAKLNLNKLLKANRSSGVNDFANWIDKGLPDFAKERKGDFPEDYSKTLAANAFDYADPGNGPTVELGSYRGVGSFPMLSEFLLKYEYLGPSASSDNQLVLNWKLTLFAEFWNMTNRPQSGSVRLSYEVASNTTAIGSGTRGLPFDDPSLLDNETKSTHDLEKIGGVYYGPPVQIDLDPDQYRFFECATVEYHIPVAPNNVSYNTKFSLVEKESEARGISVMWNGKVVDRVNKIVRDPGVSTEMEFTILYPKLAGKAAIPGHSYGPYGDFTNNMGDPRIAYYIPDLRLGENSVKNLSPNRRNIRRVTIYDLDTSTSKRNFYGRVLPSEWPDGGHDSGVGDWTVQSSNDAALKIDPTDKSFLTKMSTADPRNAPQRVSLDGRFYSATELGNVYDPLMWSPQYTNGPHDTGNVATDTTQLMGGYMPETRHRWPSVAVASATYGSGSAVRYGGGNTLRIGRPEHPKFQRHPGQEAAQLLDLFHAGISNSTDGDEVEGNEIKINGQININTASKEVLRAMMVGILQQDTKIGQVEKWDHVIRNGAYAPVPSQIELSPPAQSKSADLLADALIYSRPFGSAGEIAATRDRNDELVFGNPDLYTVKNIQWTDAAAEEAFARLYDASTLRSRNFRVWVIGQSLAGTEQNPQILAESRKVYTVFADPGTRSSQGAINPENFKTRVMYENDF
ncbi:hypothetical protein JIN85_03075 [Luteolibacter pohnpeiensis]|uniref:Verru_Chthon cassette protein A n=1 Tax=Luteolibacter pohnpeiensis TaxID=454153 RepID=A0A934S2S1_9BACT|nr:hypothetical protein [Luteolibacter pohnpeiensis]MBK1881381.1 hypothetical protein [Luteolibacter pohnpeiensis]